MVREIIAQIGQTDSGHLFFFSILFCHCSALNELTGNKEGNLR